MVVLVRFNRSNEVGEGNVQSQIFGVQNSIIEENGCSQSGNLETLIFHDPDGGAIGEEIASYFCYG